MSAVTEGRDGPALGSRENFAAPESDEYDPERTTRDDTRPSNHAASTDQKLARYAYELLLSGQSQYCPERADQEEPDGELGEKEITPKEQDQGRRVFELLTPVYRRTCPDCGLLRLWP
ncbi:hypothetical protein [Halosimplex pelagicum]|uniref:Uncharacterized protein n=1 Tax=Halosimplex pelagicum TaxID=869886 RepID=A0A7D5T8D9_9EURY|nr:hypothetical protein [Halosimplex pelagicum]QLH84828.1 hypothetical protein HZS54_25795 [Halosimplex pelagicum]